MARTPGIFSLSTRAVGSHPGYILSLSARAVGSHPRYILSQKGPQPKGKRGERTSKIGGIGTKCNSNSLNSPCVFTNSTHTHTCNGAYFFKYWAVGVAPELFVT
eukprot:1096896-Prorocentrum_minimum.AAC.1